MDHATAPDQGFHVLRRTLPLLTVWLLAGPGPARAQVWDRQDDPLPLPGFEHFAHALRAQGYRPFRTVPVDRSDDELNDRGGGIISSVRHRYRELVSCSGTELNTCTFLFAKPGQTVVDVETNGEDPASLVIFSIERLDREQAETVFRSGCDRGPTPDMPCPR